MNVTEDIKVIAPETPVKRKNTLAIIGFCLMLAGPAILITASQFFHWKWTFPVVVADIIAWTAFLLPVAALVIGIVSLTRWRRTSVLGRALSVVTVVICNPVFLAAYFFFCMLSIVILANLPLM